MRGLLQHARQSGIGGGHRHRLLDELRLPASQAAINRQTAALGLDAASLEALARAAGSRAREVPAELANRLDEAGLSAAAVMQQASTEALNAALRDVGYMLLALIGLALILSLRLARTRAAAVTRDAPARVS